MDRRDLVYLIGRLAAGGDLGSSVHTYRVVHTLRYKILRTPYRVLYVWGFVPGMFTGNPYNVLLELGVLCVWEGVSVSCLSV
jgi:hypothetical protein